MGDIIQRLRYVLDPTGLNQATSKLDALNHKTSSVGNVAQRSFGIAQAAIVGLGASAVAGSGPSDRGVSVARARQQR